MRIRDQARCPAIYSYAVTRADCVRLSSFHNSSRSTCMDVSTLFALDTEWSSIYSYWTAKTFQIREYLTIIWYGTTRAATDGRWTSDVRGRRCWFRMPLLLHATKSNRVEHQCSNKVASYLKHSIRRYNSSEYFRVKLYFGPPHRATQYVSHWSLNSSSSQYMLLHEVTHLVTHLITLVAKLWLLATTIIIG